MSQNDPVLVLTDAMVNEGIKALNMASVSGMTDGAVASGVFMAMISEMEGGRILFSDEHSDTVFRFHLPTSQ